MSTTEVAIKTHDELTITPAPIIPREDIAFDLEESERRGRFIAVYAVTPSGGGDPYSAVYHAKTRVWYCTCPATTVCKHIKSIAYYNAYNAAFRAYITCTDDELQRHDDDFARMERGRIANYRGWTIDRACLGDVIAERLKQREAA